MNISSCRIDDDNTPSQFGAETDKAELYLTEAAQAFSKVGGQAYNVSSNWSLYSFLNVSAGQAAATYNTGDWTFTVSNFE